MPALTKHVRRRRVWKKEGLGRFSWATEAGAPEHRSARTPTAWGGTWGCTRSRALWWPEDVSTRRCSPELAPCCAQGSCKRSPSRRAGPLRLQKSYMHERGRERALPSMKSSRHWHKIERQGVQALPPFPWAFLHPE